MQIPYDHSQKIKLNQHTTQPGSRQLDACRVALIIIPEQADKAVWEQIACADSLKPRYLRHTRRHKDDKRLGTDLPNSSGTHVILQALDATASSFELLTTARELAAAIHRLDPPALLLQLAGFDQTTGARLLEALIAALLASVCPMPSFKTDKDKAAALARIDVYGLAEKVELSQLRAEITGTFRTATFE